MFSTVQMKKREGHKYSLTSLRRHFLLKYCYTLTLFQSKVESFCYYHTKFWKDSLINKEVMLISKKVHVFLRHPIRCFLDMEEMTTLSQAVREA